MPAVAVADQRLPVGQRRDAGAGDRLALRVEHAAGHRHPSLGRARLRPSRIRPRLAGRLALPGSCEGVEIAGTRSEGGEQQERQCRDLEFVPKHGTENLLGQCRGGSREGARRRRDGPRTRSRRGSWNRTGGEGGTPGPIGAPARSSRARSRGARARAGAFLSPGPAGSGASRWAIAAAAPPRRERVPRSSRARPAGGTTPAGVAGLQQNAPAPRFSRTVPDHPRAPPKTGTDTQAVLADWGIDPSAFAKRERPP